MLCSQQKALQVMAAFFSFPRPFFPLQKTEEVFVESGCLSDQNFIASTCRHQGVRPRKYCIDPCRILLLYLLFTSPHVNRVNVFRIDSTAHDVKIERLECIRTDS